MKKLIIVLLTLILAMSFSSTSFAEATKVEPFEKSIVPVNADLAEVELVEGEVATVPLKFVSENNGSAISPMQTFYGDAGYVKIWPDNNYVYYEVVMYAPATSFQGNIVITDISSGNRNGYNPVSSFSGKVFYLSLDGHEYRASLSGTAYYWTNVVAQAVPNSIGWYVYK